MSDIKELISHNRRYNNEIKKFCAPLFRNFGFNCLFYHHISTDGYATSFCSDIESFEYYFHNQLYKINPYARHPDHFQSGIHLIPDINDNAYQEAIRNEADQFDLAYRVIVLEKTELGCQGFSFATSQNTPSASSSYILNHLPILQSFIRYFKQENENMLKNLLSEPHSLKKAIGKEFDLKPKIMPSSPSSQKKIELLKQMGIVHSTDETLLSPRELECMRCLLNGYTSAQTATLLDLSKRTVEHYIENVKLKTNCYTKLDLFQKFRELEALGLLS